LSGRITGDAADGRRAESSAPAAPGAPKPHGLFRQALHGTRQDYTEGPMERALILLASRLDAVAEIDAREEVDLLALAAEECARYEDCALDGEPVLVQGEARLLRRMIRNLLENASRHGRPPIEVSLRRKQDKVELCVCDHGEGVPEGERERLFEPFHRLPGATGGAGLGLSLVRQIAVRHGGSAVVRAGAAGGACISVEIAAGVDAA
jgi:signal transduction histidine kinase